MSLIETIVDRAKAFTREYVREKTPTWRWATVVSVDPVRIKYDGTGGVALIPPIVLGTPVNVGDRVQAVTTGGQTRVWKTARAGGGEFIGDDIFDSLESGVTVRSDSTALVEGRKALMTVSLIGVDRSSGNQNVPVGVLREELWPVHAFGFDAYYTDGSAQFAVTSTGAMSIRWASSSSSIQLYASGSWVLAGG